MSQKNPDSLSSDSISSDILITDSTKQVNNYKQIIKRPYSSIRNDDAGSLGFDSIQSFAENALEYILEIKALDGIVYDVKNTSSIADYIIVASGTSHRHVKGIVDNVKEKLLAHNIPPQRIEGYQEGEWIVMDYASVIIHLFFEPKRQYFKFDELFKNEKKMLLSEELNSQVRSLKTGMHSLV